MKRFLLLGLLLAGAGAQLNCQGGSKILSDLHSLVAAGLEAVNPHKPNKLMREALAAMIDLLPDGNFKDTKSLQFYNKFGVRPTDVNLPDVISSCKSQKALHQQTKIDWQAKFNQVNESLAATKRALKNEQLNHTATGQNFAELQRSIMKVSQTEEALFTNLEDLRGTIAGELVTNQLPLEEHVSLVNASFESYRTALSELATRIDDQGLMQVVGPLETLINGLIKETPATEPAGEEEVLPAGVRGMHQAPYTYATVKLTQLDRLIDQARDAIRQDPSNIGSMELGAATALRTKLATAIASVRADPILSQDEKMAADTAERALSRLEAFLHAATTTPLGPPPISP